jgi:hypothetical protein
MTDPISLEGKVAPVAGAGRGLGRAYVELLVRSRRIDAHPLGGPGFHAPHLTPESIAEDYTRVEAIVGGTRARRHKEGLVARTTRHMDPSTVRKNSRERNCLDHTEVLD